MARHLDAHRGAIILQPTLVTIVLDISIGLLQLLSHLIFTEEVTISIGIGAFNSHAGFQNTQVLPRRLTIFFHALIAPSTFRAGSGLEFTILAHGFSLAGN